MCVAFLSLTPRFFAPSTNFARCFCMTSAFFFPIALRRMSASPSEKPARTFEIRITCS